MYPCAVIPGRLKSFTPDLTAGRQKLSSNMKQDIHPKYYEKATVHCACGNTFTIGATKPEIRVEICSKCHPFYTGEEKLIDTAGRVERFRARTAKAAPKKAKKIRTKK